MILKIPKMYQYTLLTTNIKQYIRDTLKNQL